MKNIVVAEGQGFCWGVRRALEIVDEHGNVSILGDLIHNKQVVQKLEAKGKKVVYKVTGEEKHPIVVTAHGTTIENFEHIHSLGLELVDTTCPLVSSIYEEGKKLESAGYRILIFGDQNHVEVKGIASRMHEPIILNSIEETTELEIPEKVGIICQSTFSPKNFDAMVEIVQEKAKDVVVRNTICAPTKRRQISAEKLAKEVDIMIVVGGYHSSNTKKLAVMAAKFVETHHVETAEELQKEWFDGKTEVGITAGASTADWIIEDVCTRIDSFD